MKDLIQKYYNLTEELRFVVRNAEKYDPGDVSRAINEIKIYECFINDLVKLLPSKSKRNAK